jgi:hypothetical protein
MHASLFLFDEALTMLASYLLFNGSMILAGMLMVVTVLIEAYILYRLKWGLKLYSFMASLAVNSLSVGVGALLMIYGTSFHVAIIVNRGILVLTLFFLANWAITFLVETPIILLLSLDDWRLGLKAGLRMNIISYIVYAVVLAILLFAFSL